mmetsp:Transcript_32183/g.58994  ORF Transcript_32183/g.58994 Transcript_32183/m.58994 type:complete len:238 (-) Transcript_32183:122-835(-)
MEISTVDVGCSNVCFKVGKSVACLASFLMRWAQAGLRIVPICDGKVRPISKQATKKRRADRDKNRIKAFILRKNLRELRRRVYCDANDRQESDDRSTEMGEDWSSNGSIDCSMGMGEDCSWNGSSNWYNASLWSFRRRGLSSKLSKGLLVGRLSNGLAGPDSYPKGSSRWPSFAFRGGLSNGLLFWSLRLLGSGGGLSNESIVFCSGGSILPASRGGGGFSGVAGVVCGNNFPSCSA